MHLLQFLHSVSQQNFKIRPAQAPKVCLDLPEHEFENVLSTLPLGEFASNEAAKWFNTQNIDFSVSTGSIYLRCVYSGFVRITSTDDIPTDLYPSTFSQTLTLYNRKGNHSAFILNGNADTVKWLKENNITYAENSAAEIEVLVDTDLPQVFEDLNTEAAAQLAVSLKMLQMYTKYLDSFSGKTSTDVLSPEQKAYLKNFHISSGWRPPSTAGYEAEAYEMAIKGIANIPSVSEVLADRAAGRIKPGTAKAWFAECITAVDTLLATEGITVLRFKIDRETSDIKRNIQVLLALCDLTAFHSEESVTVDNRVVTFKYKPGKNG